MAQPDFDFAAELRQAEQASGIETGEQPMPQREPGTAERARAEAAPGPEPEMAGTASAEPSLYLGKYKTVEALEEAARHQQEMIGRQSTEIGELRQAVSELQAQPGPPAYSYDEIDELALDPAYARQIAYDAWQRGDQVGYDRAIRAWAEADQLGAIRFENQLQAAVQQAQQQQLLAQQYGPAQAYAEQAALERSMQRVAAKHDDFEQVLGSLDIDKLTSLGVPPQLYHGLQGSDADKDGVLETLYRWLKAEQAGTLTEAAQEAVAQQAQEAQTRRRKATVASSSTTTPPEVPVEEGERMMEVWSSRPSFASGWTRRAKEQAQ